MRSLRPRRSIKTAMAHELMMFAITQKEGDAASRCQ